MNPFKLKIQFGNESEWDNYDGFFDDILSKKKHLIKNICFSMKLTDKFKESDEKTDCYFIIEGDDFYFIADEEFYNNILKKDCLYASFLVKFDEYEYYVEIMSYEEMRDVYPVFNIVCCQGGSKQYNKNFN